MPLNDALNKIKKYGEKFLLPTWGKSEAFRSRTIEMSVDRKDTFGRCDVLYIFRYAAQYIQQTHFTKLICYCFLTL